MKPSRLRPPSPARKQRTTPSKSRADDTPANMLVVDLNQQSAEKSAQLKEWENSARAWGASVDPGASESEPEAPKPGHSNDSTVEDALRRENAALRMQLQRSEAAREALQLQAAALEAHVRHLAGELAAAQGQGPREGEGEGKAEGERPRREVMYFACLRDEVDSGAGVLPWR